MEVAVKLARQYFLDIVPAQPQRTRFIAVRRVCDKHGALLIINEVVCGMGRTGTVHAWEHDGVCPDIHTIGKGLGGGYISPGWRSGQHQSGGCLGCEVGVDVCSSNMTNKYTG